MFWFAPISKIFRKTDMNRGTYLKVMCSLPIVDSRNAPSPESEHTLQSSTAEEREDMPAAVTREKDQEDKIDHLGEGSVDTDGSSTKDDATEPKRPHSHNGTKRRKKTGVIKNVAEIEALELATEQTLKVQLTLFLSE